MTAADDYAAQVSAWQEQQARLRNGRPEGDRWGGETARRFRRDPRRPLEASLQAVAEYLHPDDVMVDVGGGAGRMSLPFASRCREVVCVDPSPGMGAEFRASAAEARITNARFVQSGWVDAPGVTGDLLLVCHVTYFVADIVPFLQKLNQAARRRVVIFMRSTPPPNSNPQLFELLRGEPQALVPGYRQLLPVMWDMGLLPDVRMLGDADEANMPGSREQVIERAAQSPGQTPEVEAARRATIAAHFDDLFAPIASGFRPRATLGARDMLVTWETGIPAV